MVDGETASVLGATVGDEELLLLLLQPMAVTASTASNEARPRCEAGRCDLRGSALIAVRILLFRIGAPADARAAPSPKASLVERTIPLSSLPRVVAGHAKERRTEGGTQRKILREFRVLERLGIATGDGQDGPGAAGH